MDKALLISILVATVIAPIWLADRKNRAEAQRKAIVAMGVVSVFYLVALLFLYPLLK